MSRSRRTYMCLLDIRFSLLVISCLCLVHCHNEELPSYNVEGQCGNTISRTTTAGVLTFERITYSAECLITVAPQKLNTSPGKVMLYFTEFDLPSPCSSITLEVVDGDDPLLNSFVQGLSDALCERNATLIETGMVFTTSGPTFSLLIRRDAYGVPATGGFTIKFASYHDGPCPDIENVTECKSGRCTPSQFHCHADIDTCGSREKEVCSESTSIFPIILGAGISTFVIICFLCIIVRKNKCKRRTQISQTQPIQNVGTSQQTSTPSSNTLSSTQNRSSSSSNPNRLPNRSNCSALPPSYDEIEPTNTEPHSLRFSAIDIASPPPYADIPPPSYDDCMVNVKTYNVTPKD